MTTTTDTAPRRGEPRYCCGITLSDGVAVYRGRVRVRLNFAGLGTHAEYFPATPEGVHTANYRIGQLRQLRAAGLTPAQAVPELTLGQWAEELLQRRTDEGLLSEGGLAWWARVTRPWREGPHAKCPLHLLNVAKVRADLRARWTAHPKSGKEELAALKAVLGLARLEGADVPDALLEVKAPRVKVQRKREALGAELRDLLVACAPPAYGRMLALQARVGNRRGELLLAERSWYDRDAATLTIPADVAKERREKRIPLLPDEVELLDEQTGALRVAAASPTSDMPATPAGVELLWPMPDGRAWPLQDGSPASGYYERHVWHPTIRQAQRRYRELEGLHDAAPTPYDTLTSHDLRVTAVTAMMAEGMSETTCAYRVGHRDAKLIRTVYDQRDRAACAAAELANIAARRAAVTAPSLEEVAR